MTYEKPEVAVERFTSDGFLDNTYVLSGYDNPTKPPVVGPVIEGNDPLQELRDAFGSIFNLGR